MMLKTTVKHALPQMGIVTLIQYSILQQFYRKSKELKKNLLKNYDFFQKQTQLQVSFRKSIAHWRGNLKEAGIIVSYGDRIFGNAVH